MTPPAVAMPQHGAARGARDSRHVTQPSIPSTMPHGPMAPSPGAPPARRLARRTLPSKAVHPGSATLPERGRWVADRPQDELNTLELLAKLGWDVDFDGSGLRRSVYRQQDLFEPHMLDLELLQVLEGLDQSALLDSASDTATVPVTTAMPVTIGDISSTTVQKREAARTVAQRSVAQRPHPLVPSDTFVPSGVSPLGPAARRAHQRAARLKTAAKKLQRSQAAAAADLEAGLAASQQQRRHTHAAASSSAATTSPALLQLPPEWPGSAAVQLPPLRRAASRSKGSNLGSALGQLMALSSNVLLSREEEVTLVTALQEGNRIRAVLAEQRRQLGRQPTGDEVAEAAGCSGGLPEVQARLVAGDAAKQQLIRSNLRLVVRIASQYRNRFAIDTMGNLTMDDLLDVGLTGLLKGLERFKPELGYKLSTYCYWWVLSAITRALTQMKWAYYVPCPTLEQLHTLYRRRREFIQQHSRNPTDQELQQATGFGRMTYQRLRRLSRMQELSLDAKPTSNGGLQKPASFEATGALGDVVVDKRQGDPLLDAETRCTADTLLRLLQRLPPKQAAVLAYGYGLRADPEWPAGVSKVLPHREIAKRIGVSTSRVGQLRQDALRNLKKMASMEVSELMGLSPRQLLLAGHPVEDEDAGATAKQMAKPRKDGIVKRSVKVKAATKRARAAPAISVLQDAAVAYV